MGTTQLELSSDEALLQDDRLLSDVPSTAPLQFKTSIRAVVNVVLSRIGARLENGPADFNYAAADESALLWHPGVSAWDYLRPLLEAAGVRLFCNEDRRWHLVNSSHAVPELMEFSESTNIITADDRISLNEDEWFDAVLYRYTWSDAAGTSHTAYDFAANPDHRKVLVIDVNRPMPAVGAAAYVLRRAEGRGRLLTMTAVSDYTAQPTRLLLATLAGTPIQTGVIGSVTWSLDTDEMTLTSRGLTDTAPTSWILAPIGLTWADLPTGLSWAEYTAN